MPVVTFHIDHHGAPENVIAFIGREWYGVAAQKKQETKRGEVWGIAFDRIKENLVSIPFDDVVVRALTSTETVGTCTSDVVLTGDAAEQYVAFELIRAIMAMEKSSVVQHARADKASNMICQMNEMVESAERMLNDLNMDRNGFSMEQYEYIRSAHKALENATENLDHAVDPS